MHKRFSVFLRPLAAAVLALGAHVAWAETITVSAAASLADAFKVIAQQYEQRHPGDKVELNFAGSGALLQQIDKGAPVDVFASADQKTMQMAEEKGLVEQGKSQAFARNSLVLIQPKDGKVALADVDGLRAQGIARIAIGNPDSVPVGRYTKATLEAGGQWEALQPKLILAQNVRQALDYVARAEVDAGFVYGTDAALMADKVKVAGVVPTQKPVVYPIAVLKKAPQPEAAQRFMALVLSADGQKVLAQFGFLPPAE